MATLNPYLNFNGNTEEAFNFYKTVFGGEFIFLQRFRDTPESAKLPAGDQDKIMHVALPIGPANILMATDALESMGHKLVAGNNFYLSLDPESEEEATRLFHDLSDGGVVTVPLEKASWGAFFGMVTDQFGIHWMVNYDYDKQR
jgi:PhnB protein